MSETVRGRACLRVQEVRYACARDHTEVDEVLRNCVVVLRVDVRDELEQRVLQVRRNLQYRGTKEGGWEGVHHRAEAGAILEEGVRILQRSLRRRTCSVMPQSRMHSRPSVVRRRLPGCGSQWSVPVSRSIVRYALIATPHSRGTSGLASLCRGRERVGWWRVEGEGRGLVMPPWEAEGEVTPPRRFGRSGRGMHAHLSRRVPSTHSVTMTVSRTRESTTAGEVTASRPRATIDACLFPRGQGGAGQGARVSSQAGGGKEAHLMLPWSRHRRGGGKKGAAARRTAKAAVFLASSR